MSTCHILLCVDPSCVWPGPVPRPAWLRSKAVCPCCQQHCSGHFQSANFVFTGQTGCKPALQTLCMQQVADLCFHLSSEGALQTDDTKRCTLYCCILGSEHSTTYAQADFTVHHTKVKVNLTISGLQVTQEGRNCLCCHRKHIPSSGMTKLLSWSKAIRHSHAN